MSDIWWVDDFEFINVAYIVSVKLEDYDIHGVERSRVIIKTVNGEYETENLDFSEAWEMVEKLSKLIGKPGQE